METIGSIIEANEKKLKIVSLSEKPIMSIQIFKDSPFAAVIDKENNEKKLVLIEELVESFIDSFSEKRKRVIFIEEKLRVYSKNLKIYELPEKQYTINYLLNGKQVKKKKLTVPRRIWVINNDPKKPHLVFVVEKWEKEKTKLYRIPFPNTHKDGKICWGLNNKKVETVQDPCQIDKFYFEQSVFTADIGNEEVYQTKRKTYNAIEFIKKFNKVQNYKNLIYVGTLSEIIDLEE